MQAMMTADAEAWLSSGIDREDMARPGQLGMIG
jgi:hypothetical protein